MINFPQNPAAGQVYTFGAKSWKWNGRAWDLQTISDAQVARAEAAAIEAANQLTRLRVADYAALRALTADVTAVYVSGYLVTAAPVGIAGVFVRDDTDNATPDNGGTVIVATNGKRWKRQFDTFTNVQWFGADPSFVKDATAAFQNAILAGSWNGTTIYIPNGTYRIEGTIYVGTYNGNQNCYSVTLVGESTHGSVFLRPKSTGTGPIITASGFHNVFEKFTMISEVNAAGTDYSASHGIFVRGNPQAGTNGIGTKECAFRNLKIYRVGVGIQVGDFDNDGKHPDIETNKFEGVEISNCHTGVLINGQNILHNPFYNCHFVDCRDYLVRQKVGGDAWFERCYFGGLYDFITNTYNVASTSKVLIEAGVVALIGNRSECWASTTGNATPRYALNVTSTDSKTIHIVGNTFTTRDNLTTEPSIKLSGSGAAGNVAVKATLINNVLYGYLEINTIDVFSMGNTYLGVASNNNGVVNGRLRSANQIAANFREIFMDSNQDEQHGQIVIKTASNNAIKHTRSAVAITSEWQGDQFYTDDGLLWGRGTGMRVTNATAGQESAVHFRGARNAGAYATMPETYGTAKPANGTWQKNDRVVNSSGNAGEPDYWKCIAAGSPGTWVANRKRGTFTCTAGATTTVNDTDVTATSIILLMPTNAAAATLMNGATSLYVSARTASTSFALATANAAAAAGTETFEYELLN